jgi:hypothetical protein
MVDSLNMGDISEQHFGRVMKAAFSNVLPALHGMEVDVGLHACLAVAFGFFVQRPTEAPEIKQFLGDITEWLTAYTAEHNPEQPN